MQKGSGYFSCDDDVEVPVDYIQKLVNHLEQNKDAGAVSGLFLQTYNDKWEDKYSITSAALTSWNFIFKLSIWVRLIVKTIYSSQE
jgi:GT2 family glycosyltransferase